MPRALTPTVAPVSEVSGLLEELDLGDLADLAREHLVEALVRDPSRRPLHLRQLAEVLIEARGRHEQADGTPDWRGHTWAYHQWLNGVYAAGPRQRPEERKRLAVAVRQQVSLVLSQRLDSGTLAAYGLHEETSDLRPGQRTHTLHRLHPGGSSQQQVGATLRILGTAHEMLAGLTRGDIEALEPGERAEAQRVLGQVEQAVQALREA
jgi:hypothetical protein